MTKLILVRGISGSGKTTLAKKIVDSDTSGNTIMVAADDFFETDAGYKFSFALIKLAHAYCQGQAFFHLIRGKNVVVHNTFTQKWEIMPYIEAAIAAGIEWEIVEPKTKWRRDPSVCAEKNTHNVPEASIQRMKDRWETTESILAFVEKGNF